MRVTSCGMTDVGMKRSNNEDNYLINDELSLFIVCDGMGGHVGGEFASAIAVNSIEEVLASIDKHPEAVREGLTDPLEVMREKVRYAIRLAGKRIYEKAAAEPEYRGMGTTANVVVIEGGNAYVAHVGDSRTYLLREDTFEQLTEDHSWVNEQIREGLLTPDEAKTHRQRNIITRSLGYQEDVLVDLQVRALRKQDVMMICSDGLSNYVEADEMGEILRGHPPQKAARRLVELACERGGDDNITTVIVRVEDAA